MYPLTVHTKHKWEAALEDLGNRLEQGEYSVGDLFPSLQEVCDTYRISETTARRVFQELKQKGWINPVRKRGTVVTRHARSSEVIYVTLSGLLTGESLNPLSWLASYNLLFEGLAGKQSLRNIRVSQIGHKFFFSHLDEFRGKDVVMSMSFIQYLDVDYPNPSEILDFLRNAIHPIITMADEQIPAGLSHIRTDYRKGAVKASEHLLGKGHKRIALITGDVNYPFFQHQFQAYLDTLRDKCIPVDFDLIKTTDGNDPVQDWTAIERLLKLPDPPTAILCANDTRALHLLEYCGSRGIRVPDDLAVTGYDNREETRFSRPPLTTVDMQLVKQGEKALDLIMKRTAGELKEPAVVTLEPELIVREST